MPVVYVNGTARHNLGATTANQKQTTYGFNTLANHSGAIALFYKGSTALTSLVDSLGNNYNVHCGIDGVSRMGSGTLELRGCSSLIAGTDPTITAAFAGVQTEVDMYPVMYSGCDLTGMWNTSGAAQGTGTGTTITSNAFTPGIAAGAVLAFGVTNDNNASAGLIGGVAAALRLAPVGWATALQDRVFSATLGAGITAGIAMSSSFTLGAIIVGILKQAAAALTKKYAVPTALADGTQRRLVVFSDTGLGTKLVTPQLVTAAGGFFKYTDTGAVVGTKYPAMLWSFGADQNADARGGPCWATGIEE